jgi:hypothetical protein
MEKRNCIIEKPKDFSEGIQVQRGDVSDIPPQPSVSAQRSKTNYIIPAITATAFDPTGRLLKSTVEGTLYAIPRVVRTGWWTVLKAFEALGSTLSTSNDGGVYGVEGVRDVRADRVMAEDGM